MNSNANSVNKSDNCHRELLLFSHTRIHVHIYVADVSCKDVVKMNSFNYYLLISISLVVVVLLYGLVSTRLQHSKNIQVV